ncbi:MAG: 30S ribosomal protein S27ae [Candidatus Altiarchaeota archaeon]|nr:30S ribosomal protein S27ae [Candidatus Altiarchaeota archaeon]
MADEKADKKGKEGKVEKSGSGSKKWAAYDVSGSSVVRKRKSCPKCGDGVFMAKHKDRESCGKCGYTEFQKKQ